MRSSDNLLMMLRRASPSAFLTKIVCLLARASPWAHHVPNVAAWSGHTGGPFLFRTGAAGGAKARDLRHKNLGHAFLQQVPSLMLAAQAVYHPHLHPHPCLVHELDRLVFALT